MRWKPLVCAAALALLAACYALPAAADSGTELLFKGVESYEFADFQEADGFLQQAVRSQDLSPSLRAKAYVYLGLTRLALNDAKGAEQAFGRAKGLKPGLSLEGDKYPPRAREVFARAKVIPPPGGASAPAAPAAPAASSAPPPPPPPPSSGGIRESSLGGTKAPAAPGAGSTAPPAPAPTPAKPPRGYVLQVDGQDVLLDLGRKQGVRPGSRFEVLDQRPIKHPVTGQVMLMSRRVGLLEVREVQPELSLARLVQGKLSRLRPGMRLKKTTAGPPPAPASPKPAPSAAAVATPAPGGGIRVMVLPPSLNVGEAFGIVEESDFKVSEVVKALGVFRPLRPLAVPSSAKHNWAELDEEGMRRVMRKLKMPVVVQWEVSMSGRDARATLSLNVYRLGKDPFVVTKWTNVQEDLVGQNRYAKIISRMVGQALGLIM